MCLNKHKNDQTGVKDSYGELNVYNQYVDHAHDDMSCQLIMRRI